MLTNNVNVNLKKKLLLKKFLIKIYFNNFLTSES